MVGVFKVFLGFVVGVFLDFLGLHALFMVSHFLGFHTF